MAQLSVWATLALLIPVKCLFAGDSCIADDTPGSCVRISDCKPITEEIIKAGNPMPIRIRLKLQDLSCDRFDSGEPVICCIPYSDTSNHDTTTLITRDKSKDKPTPATDDTITESRLGEVPANVQNHPNLDLLPPVCGVSEGARVYGGNVTQLYEMPWMVLLAYDSPRGIKLSCAGTIISRWYVLTAAHCVTLLGNGLTLKGVVLGEHDIRKNPDCERIEDKKFCAPSARNSSIEKIIAHKGYNNKNFSDDIALLRLSEPADFDLDNMKPICLPITPKLQNEDLVGVGGIVAGWGATETGLQSPVLLSVELPIVGKEECQKVHNEIAVITDRKLCAGGIEDYDSCSGDSGGPLIYPGRVWDKVTRYVQRGIVSYGARRCGRAGFPGVYTKVSHYMDWILDHIEK